MDLYDQLDDNKRKTLKTFKARVRDVLKTAHDDRFLLRWLRARNYNLEQAELMLREDVQFRRLMGSDTITEWYKIPEEWLPFIFTTLLGFDKAGHPVRLVNYRKVDLKGIHRLIPLKKLQEFVVYTCEKDQQLLEEHNRKNNVNIETFTYIADYADFNYLQFTNKTIFQVGLHMCHIYLDHYPETLHRVYIINAPQLFSIVYDLFKPFIADSVLRKVRIFGQDGWQEELHSTLPKDIIPAHLGGSREQPNGDAYCNDIKVINEPIPKSSPYTPSMSASDSGVNVAFLAPKAVFKTSLDVSMLGVFLCWRFQVKEYDIQFSLIFSPSKKLDGANGTIEILPRRRVDCSETPEDGKYMCEEYGTYTFIFDNSASWFRPKDLWYKIGLRTPSEIRDF